MNLSLCSVICCIAVSCFAIGLANETANSKKSSPKNPPKEAIPIDDEDADVEGSGFEESRSDLESSGSGYGPDDEDSDHGLGPFKINPKSGRGGDVTIPMPSSTIKSISSSSAPTFKPISESPPTPDENSRSIPVNPSIDENKNTLRNNNFNPVEIENRATTPKKSIDEEIILDNHHPDDKNVDDNKSENNGVYKVTPPDRDRATSFFAQPGILAAVIGGAVVGLLCAILVVMFIVYRMRKKDEGSYPLEEMKRCPAYNPYMKPTHREFFA